MITGIDHIAVEVADAAASAADYAAVLGRQPGPETGQLQLDNTAVRFQGGTAAGAQRDVPVHLRLVLATADLPAAMHRLTRRGLPGSVRQADGVFEIETGTTHGVAIGVAAARGAVAMDEAADISGLDHIVVRTPDPERAVALYGGRLGLDLRLDRTNAEHGNRLLFFVCGGLVIEISHDTRKGVGSGPDRIFGLAWRARDIEAAHARMSAAGVAVSEIRVGRRPGTRVFTVKSRTAGVPTLVIGGDGLARS